MHNHRRAEDGNSGCFAGVMPPAACLPVHEIQSVWLRKKGDSFLTKRLPFQVFFSAANTPCR